MWYICGYVVHHIFLHDLSPSDTTMYTSLYGKVTGDNFHEILGDFGVVNHDMVVILLQLHLAIIIVAFVLSEPN